MESEDKRISLIVKWSGKEYVIEDVEPTWSFCDLKDEIWHKTGVKQNRQKLMGVKVSGKQAVDEHLIKDSNLKNGSKVMMMGSREEDIASVDVAAKDIPNVVNDLDINEEEMGEIAVDKREEFQAKIAKRVKEYQINVFNQPRPGKKLLVLDIDYTLFDHRSTAECASQLMRPFLHEFLASAYEHYDIAIWSATGMKWIEVKMRELGVSRNENYKIAFYLDSSAMISVYTDKYGLVDVKPLGVIWGKFECYTPKNTIMFDDIRKNFLMNPKNGLRIKPFREAYKNRQKDRELLYLAEYLRRIANEEDLTTLNHKHWHRYVRFD